MTNFASGLRSPRGMVFGIDGFLLVADPGASRIWYVGSPGVLQPLISLSNAQSIAFDGFGDLLVTTGSDAVYRVTLGGDRSVFATAGRPGAIVVDREGDVWIGAQREIIRFSPLGIPLTSIPLPTGCAGVVSLAISPTRVLHFVAGGCGGVHRVVNGVPELVIRSPGTLGALAFDAHGWLWATDAVRSVVLLFDPGYQLREDPFVTNVSPRAGLVFARAPTGMTSRLLAAQSASTTADLMEMNPRGMGAVGAPIGTDLLISRTDVRAPTHTVPYRDTLRVLVPHSIVPVWSLFEGGLPPGISLGSNGVLRGTPSVPGTYRFSVVAQHGDSLGFGRFTMTVNSLTALEVARALLGVAGAELGIDVELVVDLQGNKNHVMDIGDLRAYLRKQGTLP